MLDTHAGAFVIIKPPGQGNIKPPGQGISSRRDRAYQAAGTGPRDLSKGNERAVSSDVSILNLILDSGAVAKTVIVVLLVFSVVSWAIMADRWRYFRRAQAQSRRFLDFFQSQRDYDQVYNAASQWPGSPAAVVFREVYEKHAPAFSPRGGGADQADQAGQGGGAGQADQAGQGGGAGQADQADQADQGGGAGRAVQAERATPATPAAQAARAVRAARAVQAARATRAGQASQADLADQAGRSMEIDQDQLEVVYRDLRVAAHRQLAKFDQRLPVLATTGSVCPFLGLFGTVWGVMTAFLDISTQGSTNIVVVAPGIAEALITTIAGLAVAIPAMVGYNYFVQRSRTLGLELEDLATAVLNILQLRGRHERL